MTQIVNIAHARDNAHMIALAVGNPAAYGEIFNCVRDKGVTLDGLVDMCAAAAGVKPTTIHYGACVWPLYRIPHLCRESNEVPANRRGRNGI
jgi:nucleoside-diphosphate-sugar epimerase